MSLRILHVISSVNPAQGGPIEGLTQMARANQKQGHTVEVVSLDDPDDPWTKECPLKCHAMGPSWLSYRYSPRLVTWLRQHQADYDAVIVNGIWQYGSFATWRALSQSSTPYFVFTHGMLDPYFKHAYPLKHLKKWLYWPWAEYRVLRDAAAVIFTCDEERLLARQTFWLYRCNEFVVNYGTAAPAGDPETQRNLFLDKFPQVRGKRCLLFIGRLHEKKGLDLALKAFAAVLQQLPAAQTQNLHLIAAGPSKDAYGEQMKALASSLGLDQRVTWTGMLKGDLKWGAFHSADAFVLSSHQENFGIAVAEALACGLPVLISNKVNIWREIEKDGAGFVDADDLPGTRRLLEKWIQADPGLWEKMRAAAIACFYQRFFIDRTAESFMKALQSFGLQRKRAASASPGTAGTSTEN